MEIAQEEKGNKLKKSGYFFEVSLLEAHGTTDVIRVESSVNTVSLAEKVIGLIH